MLLQVLEIAFMVVFTVVTVTQLIIPLFLNKPTFPALRNRTQHKTLKQLEDELEREELEHKISALREQHLKEIEKDLQKYDLINKHKELE